jgi:hypothetical protein
MRRSRRASNGSTFSLFPSMSSGSNRPRTRTGGTRSITRSVIYQSFAFTLAESPAAFKGLGTSLDTDGRDYFLDMAQHMIPFGSTQNGDRELIDLAFSKKKADDRKEWLRHFRVRRVVLCVVVRVGFVDSAISSARHVS